ncbi:uncharacterized protein [Primulina eburnea]|uniref:uncharacterized protein n=1 Tax=Primulina eburnea TaxID=1245227 RepID=UPI003C6C34B6
MSRCFPYPPPGYTPSRASKEALIESIKLRKELEKTKARNKQEERRVKKDERKERKDEKSEIGKLTYEKTDPNSKKRRKRKEGREEKERRRKERNGKHDLNSNKVGLPNEPIGKNIWENSEQLERSDLTEEHDLPICLHLPSTSFESTENSSAMKRHSSPVNVIRGLGTIIRIQLSSRKKNLSDISINEQQLCSTSGRTDIPPLRNRQQNFCAPTEKTSDFVLGDFNRTDKKQIISTSGKSEPPAPAKTGTPSVLDAIEVSKKSSKTMQYKNPIENWVPPSLQDAPSSPEDLDWLFSSKVHGLPSERRRKIENDSVFCSSSSSLLQPRAQLLPEFDVYALPFTVPY